MKITSLKKRSNNVFVGFEDGSKIIIDYRVAVDNGLRENDELYENQINNLKFQTEKLKIKDSAFRLLGRRLHSVHEIRQKLIKKGFNKTDIINIVNDLNEKGYLDDLSFAKAFINEKLTRKKSGMMKIQAGLIQKGISRKIIDECLLEVDQSIALDNAKILAEKKYRNLIQRETDKRKIKQKIFSYLFSKGFQSEVIIQSINQLKLNDDDNLDL